MSDIKNGLMIAGVAAALFAAGFTANVSAAEATEVKCLGGNQCKGTSQCKGKVKGHENSCKGTNACKGKGWATMTPEECKKIKDAKAEPMAKEKQ